MKQYYIITTLVALGLFGSTFEAEAQVLPFNPDPGHSPHQTYCESRSSEIRSCQGRMGRSNDFIGCLVDCEVYYGVPFETPDFGSPFFRDQLNSCNEECYYCFHLLETCQLDLPIALY